jgi:hypothetical protein
MRYPLLFLVALALAGPAAAQQTELSGRAGLGLFRFGGQDAATISGISYYGDYFGKGPSGHAYEPYGRKVGAGFGASGRVQRVGERQGLLTLDIGYDWLQSEVDVNHLDYSSSLFSSFIASYEAEGKVQLRSQRLTAFAGLGHRFKIGAAELDVLAGPEVAYVFDIHQKGAGTYDNGTSWTMQHADMTLWYRKLGFTTSYVHGVVNHQSGLTGGNPKVYSRIWRLGMAYRLQ